MKFLDFVAKFSLLVHMYHNKCILFKIEEIGGY